MRNLKLFLNSLSNEGQAVERLGVSSWVIQCLN
jgi:hypothetical protein